MAGSSPRAVKAGMAGKPAIAIPGRAVAARTGGPAMLRQGTHSRAGDRNGGLLPPATHEARRPADGSPPFGHGAEPAAHGLDRQPRTAHPEIRHTLIEAHSLEPDVSGPTHEADREDRRSRSHRCCT